MGFTIDRQSLDELNLMGKFRQGSVYFLFNQVKSRGGEYLLDQLFKQPLVDEHAINRRAAIFQFFQDARLQFPFDTQQLILMREYVDSPNDQGQLAGFLNILLKKGLANLTRDDKYKILINGLQATILTLKKCYSFVAELSSHPGPYKERVTIIQQILNSSHLSHIVETDIYKKTSAKTFAKFNYLLRNKLNAEIKTILEFIAEVDVNIAVGKVAKEKGFTYAKALPKTANSLKAVDLRHPCIDKAIGNNIEMHEHSNVIFLTGANMAGKSTWMKSVGINLYLAHIGFPVAAESMEFSIKEGIFSSINVSDNIALGYSHFYAEVVRVKNAAEATATGKHLLVMFDELFKGTNVKDAYDGTLAVTEAFSDYVNCLFIVSTHIIEVGDSLKARENIQFRFMPTVMNGKIPTYTYRLEKGITEDRHGMMIIRNEGIINLMNNTSN